MPDQPQSQVIYKRIRRIALLMDGAFRFPGTRFRFGLNSVIGLPPGVGDAALVIISLWIIWQARKLGLPRIKLGKMFANVLIEAAIGWTPLLGDVLDVVWKANLRNLKIIEDHLDQHVHAQFYSSIND